MENLGQLNYKTNIRCYQSWCLHLCMRKSKVQHGLKVSQLLRAERTWHLNVISNSKLFTQCDFVRKWSMKPCIDRKFLSLFITIGAHYMHVCVHMYCQTFCWYIKLIYIEFNNFLASLPTFLKTILELSMSPTKCLNLCYFYFML